MANIEFEGISKSFGSVKVIDNLSLTVNSGEFLVFLGPSGSGKSTLLRMIAGLEKVNSGRIKIDGKECQDWAPGKRGVAMVFQNYALYPHMTVRQNMAFGLKNIKLSADEIDRRVKEAAQMLEMEELLDRLPSQLSGGQRQRTAIGRAIVKEPLAFLFDEPLSNLDAALRVRTRVELAELHQRMKSTIVYVTHDQTEAMTMANRIVILNECKIEQIGTPMEVYTRPESRFVAEFIGSPPMNMLPVKVSSDESRLQVILEDGTTLQSEIESPINGEFDLGVRPEAVTISASGETKGQAKIVEYVGERTIVYVQLSDGKLITAQDISSSMVKPGDNVQLKFDTSNLHFFDQRGTAFHSK